MEFECPGVAELHIGRLFGVFEDRGPGLTGIFVIALAPVLRDVLIIPHLSVVTCHQNALGFLGELHASHLSPQPFFRCRTFLGSHGSREPR